jgi:hypothetical protein
MSGHIQQYWKDLKILEATLPEFVWLVATAVGAPPFVTQVAANVAAKLLHAKSHRVADDEEVAANRANDAATLKQAKQERMRRSGAAIVVVDDEASPEATTSEPSPRCRR